MSTRRSIFKRIAAALVGATVAPEVITLPMVTTHRFYRNYNWPPVLEGIRFMTDEYFLTDAEALSGAIDRVGRSSGFSALLQRDPLPDNLGYNFKAIKHEA